VPHHSSARFYPILAVSAVDSGDEALDAGADAFLHKPLDRCGSSHTVRDLIGTSAYLLEAGNCCERPALQRLRAFSTTS